MTESEHLLLQQGPATPVKRVAIAAGEPPNVRHSLRRSALEGLPCVIGVLKQSPPVVLPWPF